MKLLSVAAVYSEQQPAVRLVLVALEPAAALIVPTALVVRFPALPVSLLSCLGSQPFSAVVPVLSESVQRMPCRHLSEH